MRDSKNDFFFHFEYGTLNIGSVGLTILRLISGLCWNLFLVSVPTHSRTLNSHTYFDLTKVWLFGLSFLKFKNRKVFFSNFQQKNLKQKVETLIKKEENTFSKCMNKKTNSNTILYRLYLRCEVLLPY